MRMHSRTGKKGQEKILIDMVAIVVFVIAILIFIIIFNVKKAAEQESMQTAMALADNHLKLLEFLKSDYKDGTVADFLANANSKESKDEIEKLLLSYFDAKYGEGWTAAVEYPVSRGGNTVSEGHTQITQQASAIIKKLFSGPTSLIVLESSIKSTQQIPTPEGETITITLESWMAFAT